MSIIPDYFMEATVALGQNITPNPRWCATGFIVGRYEGESEGESKFSTYLITNKHVVDDESEMVMQVNLQKGVKSYLLSLVDDQGSKKYSIHPSADVIAYHIDINKARSEGAQLPFFDLVDDSLTLQQMRDTGVCEGCLAYTLGFPVSIDNDFVNSTVKSPMLSIVVIRTI